MEIQNQGLTQACALSTVELCPYVPVLILRDFFLSKSPPILLQCKYSYENILMCVCFALLFLLRASEQIHGGDPAPERLFFSFLASGFLPSPWSRLLLLYGAFVFPKGVSLFSHLPSSSFQLL